MDTVILENSTSNASEIEQLVLRDSYEIQLKMNDEC